MSTEQRVVGPVPDGEEADAYDRQRRRILWSMPSGLYVLGSRAGDQRNLMTTSWATQVSMDPKLLAVSVEAGALTHRLIEEGQAFSLNIIGRQDRAVVRKFVKPLDDEGGPAELAGFALRAGVTGAPILELAVAWLDCRLHEQVGLGSHTLFIGEIAACGWGSAGGEAEELEVLRMEDTRMSYGG